MKKTPLDRLREICLSLPETIEKEAWGTATFRAGGKMFAMFIDNHHGDGRVAVWSKNSLGVQEILVGADPRRFFKPPYVGHKGWLGIRLDLDVDWSEVSDLMKDGYRLAAPKKLVKLLGDEPTAEPAAKAKRPQRTRAKIAVAKPARSARSSAGRGRR